MITQEENELLTRIGPGTAMGTLLRRYWLPALLADELPEPDCKPVRIRLLGEDLVAFRDTAGKVGLLPEACPHRRASLALGLNHEGGLRCLYHGYKFSVDGSCLETPTESNPRFRHNLRAHVYPTEERGGMIWAYMGRPDQRPELPAFPWLSLPPTHARPFKIMAECNFFQALEGTVDSAHAGILHRRTPWGAQGRASGGDDDMSEVPFTNTAPRLEVQFTAYGMRYAALRNLVNGERHARITAAVLPCWVIIPPFAGGLHRNRRLANAFVPRDDYSTWHIQYFFDSTNPVDVAFRKEEGGYWKDENHRKLRNIDNWYMQDRAAMKTRIFSGIDGIITQDHAVGETQGRIADRTREYLGTSDLAIVAMRRLMLRAIQGMTTEGKDPPGLDRTIPYQTVTSEFARIPAGKRWQDYVPTMTAASKSP